MSRLGISVLSDATINNTKIIEVNRADFENQIRQIDGRLMALAVDVKQKLEQNDQKFEQVDRKLKEVDEKLKQNDQKFDQVDRTIDEMGKNLRGLSVELSRVAAEVSRISTHLGLQGPPPG